MRQILRHPESLGGVGLTKFPLEDTFYPFPLFCHCGAIIFNCTLSIVHTAHKLWTWPLYKDFTSEPKAFAQYVANSLEMAKWSQQV